MVDASSLKSPPDPTRRGLLAVVGLIVCVLVIGGVVVVKAMLATPAPVRADKVGGVRDGAAALEAGLNAAAQYQRERKFPEAVAILEKLAQQSPTDRAVRVAYAQALIGEGGIEKHAEAYKQYEAAIALSGEAPVKPTPGADGSMPSAPPTGVKRDPALAQLHFEAGTCASVAGLTDRAVEHYWMAQVLDPNEARYPLFLAMVQLKKGSDAEAMASLVRAAKMNPDMAEAWGTMAEVELRKNQNGLALQHIETARKLQPEVTRWKVVQARALNRQAEPEQAAAVLRTLPDVERMRPEMLALAAECYGMMQKPGDAAALYAEAVKRTPTDGELAYQAALWYEKAGDKAKAVELAKRAGMLGHEGVGELLKSLGQK